MSKTYMNTEFLKVTWLEHILSKQKEEKLSRVCQHSFQQFMITPLIHMYNISGDQLLQQHDD